jgi:hypothetical protein
MPDLGILREALDVTTLHAPNNGPENDQYEGLFHGMGLRSKRPICNRRNSDLKRLHNIAHFAVGAKHWDSAEKTTTSHEAYQDHGVAFQHIGIPEKNASVVELKQGGYDGNVHFRTEMREQYKECYRPRLPQCDPPPCRVHLGDDKPALLSHSNATHVRQDNREARSTSTGQPFRAAGVGTLLRTTSWPRVPRGNPVTAGPRNPDHYDLHTDGVKVETTAFGRKTANRSSIVYHPNVRDPILGIHIPKDKIQVSDLKTTAEIIGESNSSVPALRTLAAVRPSSGRTAMKYPEAY